jgi:hypothetical protein
MTPRSIGTTAALARSDTAYEKAWVAVAGCVFLARSGTPSDAHNYGMVSV